ncbi:MAG: membrane biogenesis protein [Candidatus Peribacteria bacterium]|jgi:predicted TIM-barrel enzyme|nr:membrane biogenesis protein [Candidatus Peribacteria bacterium]
MNTNNFLSIFPVEKPIIGMLHLKGSSSQDCLSRTQREIALMLNNGIDAVLVENYFGKVADVEAVLKWLDKECSQAIYGVNILAHTMPEPLAFNLAHQYGAKFIQIDSVAGHLPPTEDLNMECKLQQLRNNFPIPIIGGVRFKYQPIQSNRNEKEDVKIGMTRCDAIAITGEGTGIETDLQKIKRFRSIVGNFPLVVAAGLTDSNCLSQMAIGDACIVGSFLKDTGKDSGDISVEKIKRLVSQIENLRP